VSDPEIPPKSSSLRPPKSFSKITKIKKFFKKRFDKLYYLIDNRSEQKEEESFETLRRKKLCIYLIE
ncbi:MAG: hypothetical protein ACLVA2_08040, partial [Clostridia bacterium]